MKRPKKATPDDFVKIEIDLETEDKYKNFSDAYIRLSDVAGHPIGYLEFEEATFKVYYTGRLDTLFNIWYITGAFAERSYLTKTVIKPN